jgi:hypothetical protein
LNALLSYLDYYFYSLISYALLINYNNINSSDSYSTFPNHISTSSLSSLPIEQSSQSLHNQNNELHQFNHLISPNQINTNQLEQTRNNFVVPQKTIMSEADRKRAHHNALERKRRDHIKDSFHTLRDAIPNIKGEKVSTSRAQILKAATDYIKTMKNRNTVYQNDIDLIKKQNMEIETQIRLLEKSKLQNGNQCLNSNIIMKTEHSVPATPNNLQLNDTNSDDNDFKFELSESLHQNNTNSLNKNSNNSNNVLKTNNVLILTKPNGANGQTTSKKFKTIVNTKNPNLMKNGKFL